MSEESSATSPMAAADSYLYVHKDSLYHFYFDEMTISQ